MSISLTALQELFDRFRQFPFPRGTVNGELYEIHGKLAEYDGYIAGLISSLLKNRSIPAGSLYFDTDLETKLTVIAHHGGSPAREAAKTYFNYLSKLKELINLGLEIIESGHQTDGA